MSITEELIDHIRRTRFEMIDEDVVVHAKKRIIDVVGCAAAGVRAPVFPLAIDLVRHWGGRRESIILIPHGDKVPACNAAMVNSILASAFDFEPIRPVIEGRLSYGHFSATTVPTAMAVAEQKDLGGKELLTALTVGEDITARLAAASAYSSTEGASGWAGESTIGCFGAAIIASKLCGLNERQILNMLGITLNQAAGTLQCLREKSHCYKLNHGFAARNGITSVELASMGFGGLKDPLLGEYGYFSLYCRTYDTEILTRDLGKKFYSDRILKRYPSCLFTHPAIDCAMEIVRMNCVEPSGIDDVTVSLFLEPGRDIVTRPFEVGSDPHMDANWSIPYTVANVLLRKSIRLEHMTDKFVLAPDVLELARRVKVNNSPEQGITRVGVRVRTKSGEEYSAYANASVDDPCQEPMTMEQIKEKFRDNMRFAGGLSADNQEKILSKLERLEDADNVRGITALLG